MSTGAGMAENELALPGVAYAEANWGRWVANCPTPWCTNAVYLERGDTHIQCGGGWDACGKTSDVCWPPDPDAIELILSMRPIRRTQNWLPGETLEDLLTENAQHDCMPPDWLALASGMPDGRLALLETIDGRAVGGLVHEALTAGRHYRIGA